jgi:hypothetical protein
MALQEEFHDHQKAEQSERLKLRKKAEMGMRHVLYYIEKNE